MTLLRLVTAGWKDRVLGYFLGTSPKARVPFQV